MSLVAWGETHIDSSIAAIAQSSVPIFVTLFGLRVLPHETAGRCEWPASRPGSAESQS